jgi:hypothetical protein
MTDCDERLRDELLQLVDQAPAISAEEAIAHASDGRHLRSASAFRPPSWSQEPLGRSSPRGRGHLLGRRPRRDTRRPADRWSQSHETRPEGTSSPDHGQRRTAGHKLSQPDLLHGGWLDGFEGGSGPFRAVERLELGTRCHSEPSARDRGHVDLRLVRLVVVLRGARLGRARRQTKVVVWRELGRHLVAARVVPGTGRRGQPVQRVAYVTGLSCSKSGYCMAVGFYGASSGRSGLKPLVAERVAGRWVQTATPQVTELAGVSCVSSTFCLAAGTSPPTGQPVLLQWDGQKWQTLSIGTGLSSPLSISCASTTACMLVGWISSGGSPAFPAAFTWGSNPLDWRMSGVGGCCPGPGSKRRRTFGPERVDRADRDERELRDGIFLRRGCDRDTSVVTRRVRPDRRLRGGVDSRQVAPTAHAAVPR